MITVVGLTPSIDRHIRLARLTVGGTNRPLKVEDTAGGKGLNVSVMLHRLGCPVHLITPAYQSGMEPLYALLRGEGVPFTPLPLPGALRVNTKLMDLSASTVTEINLPARLGEPAAAGACLDAAARLARQSRWLVLTGSLPADVPPDFYAQLIARVRRLAPSCRILLDAEGEPLRLGLQQAPDMIKPNRHELEMLVGQPLPSASAVAQQAALLVRGGVGAVLVSMDTEGSLLVTPEGCLAAGCIPVPVATTVGAGDSLVAGYLSALVRHPDGCEAALRMGVACATAHVAGDDGGYSRYLERAALRALPLPL